MLTLVILAGMLPGLVPAGAQTTTTQTNSCPASIAGAEQGSTVDDFTTHSYNASGVAYGSFADCVITRTFSEAIASLKLTIVEGFADDVGFVGDQQVTPTMTNCTQPPGGSIVQSPVDVSSQVTINGSTAQVVLRAKDTCIGIAGWGNFSGRAPAKFHWQVSLVSDGSCLGMPREGDIVGTPGPDRLIGTMGPDRIFGLGGDDEIEGLGGNDTIFGGAGQDRLSGGDGDDILCGGGDRDLLSGGDGNDVLSGEDGDDDLDGGPGSNVNDGGPGLDRCVNPWPGLNCSG